MTATTTPLVELDAVAVTTGGRALIEVERFAVAPGETVAVLGVNGAGKSTLLRVAAGLREPSAGTVRLDGSPATPAAFGATVAAVLQRPLLRRGTVRANVELGLRFRGCSRKEARGRARPWLARLGIATLADVRTARLSGGEAQRVSLARALAVEPRLLVLDEPFSALDGPTRAELLGELRAILAAAGTAALLATHDVREAQLLGDRVVVLHEGRVRQDAPAAEALARPADEVCARVLRAWDTASRPDTAVPD